MKSAADQLAALGDPFRLRVFRLLAISAHPLCVCEIVDALAVPQYQVSRALAGLRRAGLAKDAREGTWVTYALPADLSAVGRGLAALVRDHVTGGTFRQDESRVKLRLGFRAAGRCVVGLNDPVIGAALARAADSGGAPFSQPAGVEQESMR